MGGERTYRKEKLNKDHMECVWSNKLECGYWMK